jgi:hypothetical protein
MAFTNPASLLINGQTFHAALRMDLQGRVCKKAMKTFLSKYDTIIIDEVSMLGMQIYEVLCTLPQSMRIFAFGDFRQHPPIEAFGREYKKSQMFMSMFGNNRLVLRKQWRANPEYANSCVDYYKKFKKRIASHGYKNANKTVKLPTGVKVVKTINNAPDLSICMTNPKPSTVNQSHSIIAIVSRYSRKMPVSLNVSSISTVISLVKYAGILRNTLTNSIASTGRLRKSL